MRAASKNEVLAGRAIAGKYVVFLAWDLVDWNDPAHAALMGFAIERCELDGTGQIVEKYFLQGIKRFANRDQTIPPATPASTADNPVQAFQWGDYTAKPGTRYAYRIVPMQGTPKKLEADDESALALEAVTQDEWLGRPPGEVRPVHSIHFNRGVAGSQAYARKFGNTAPDQDNPDSEQMRWLSRNVYEAITGFIGCAAEGFGLRGAFYEFHYLPVLQAFRSAVTRGADVRLLYEAQEYKDVNEQTIAAAALVDVCAPQRVRPGIRHNKFLVLLEKDEPVAVMTGSTNISAGGIFGHSNVLHIVWDRTLAAAYLEYWEQLSKPEVSTHELKVFNNQATPLSPANAVNYGALFSPRDTSTDKTLDWYAERYRSVNHLACMTFAFGLADCFEQVLATPDGAVRYAVFDKAIKQDVADSIDATSNSVVACGAKLAPGDLECFIGEHLTGFNKNAYIHDKFLLCDPLGSSPLVVSGSANFSPASQVSNDENMLVIPGDTEVADAYFGEFMRVFEHLYARYVVGLLKKEGKNNPNAGYLKDTPSGWLQSQKGKRKSLRRAAFLA